MERLTHTARTGLNRTRHFLRRLRKDVAGNTLTLLGFGMIPMIGSLGLGTDAAQWVLWKRQLHSAADLAALAGARALADGQPVTPSVNRSLAFNDLNGYTVSAIENAPKSGSHKDDSNAVRVELTMSKSLPFSSLFMTTAPQLTVSATAQSQSTAPSCVITLDTAGTGIEIVGSAIVDMDCALYSNSDFSATSSDSINAAALAAVGTVTAGSAVTTDTLIIDSADVIEDPFDALPLPETQTSCYPNSWPLIKSNTTLSAGCYHGLQIQGGVVTLNAGTYYLGEKGISIAAGATLKGTGVTLVFTNNDSAFNSSKIGQFTIAGGATVQLTAPTTGTYQGVIVYQDPRTPLKNANWVKITGNSGSKFEGAIYAPSTGVKFTGNTGINTACMQIVALYAAFEGNTSVSNTCPGTSGSAAFGGGDAVRLVE